MAWLWYLLLVPMAAGVLYFLIPGIFALLVSPKREYDRHSPLYRTLLNVATAIGLFVTRVRIHVSGSEKLPRNTRCLFVSNHRSNFDPIITWHALRDFRLSFISKAGNFKIFVFGRIIRRCCFLMIDRKNPRAALHTVNRAAALLRSGEVSVGVYPEGTRAKDCVMQPFHSGMLRIAQKAQAPVVVLAVRGTEQIHKHFPFHRTHVYLDVLEVIDATEVVGKRAADLSAYAENRIREHLSYVEKGDES